ncbi:hypothetical protein E8E13_001358 [Curvularia kusanoi]|uniref:Uncharacterized protein n=1 Tax=Curvularia kusanoi TaxID=90978 RepID=A0A9P4TFJ2_CURKU|nr:hypothetical protein E8E13_001358 [Curvularia kusanoi]
MSRVVAKVLSLKAELTLINALSEFENSLPKEQKAIFRMRRSTTPTSQDVQQFVAEFDLADLSVTAKSCEDTHTTGDPEKVLEVLLQGFSSSVKVYFVLDGLDECETKERETLLRALRKIQEKINISVCASFREESNHGLQSITKQLLNTRIVSIPKDNPDIASFIEADLERRIQDKLLNIRDEKLKWDIQKALLEGSSGMFLWVDLQIRTLCSLNTDYAIRKALLDLPKDISETYARILRKSGSSDPEFQVKTLQLVLAARRPLTEDELLEALSVVPGDADYDPSKILNNVDAALGHCGCLLVTDEEELTVRVVHRSVKQYLLNGSESAKHRKFSEEEASRTLADVVVTYLSYKALEGEVSKPNSQQKTSQIAPLRMLQNPEFPETPQRVLAKWLRAKSRPPLDVDLGSLFGVEHGHTEPKLQSTFKFQHYARKYWKDHLPHVSGKNTRIVEMSAQLMLKRADDRDWTRWKQTFEEGHETITLLFIHAGKIAPRSRDGEGGKPLIWAAEKGYKDTVKELLRSGGADVNAKDKNGWTSLMHAAFKGRSDIVETLLSVSGVEVDVICGGRTPLMQAARSGHKDTVKMLLSDGRADVEAKDRHGYAPLLHAADCGHEDVVGMLLDVGNIDVETQDILGNTPLIQAARKGNTETVEVLLRKANAEATNNIGYTPLMVAASYGHSSTVSVLLGTADVEAKNAVGRTALIEAVRERKKDIVVLLIDMSAGKADVHAADDYGWTALMYAEDQNDEDIAEVLRQHVNELAAKQT